MRKEQYDAIVVGGGPNGLAAAILMQQQGLSVLLLEGKEIVGGGVRSEELHYPGFWYDPCSAIHPLAVQSPFFKTLPLCDYGLEYINPLILAAHPLSESSECAVLLQSLTATAHQFSLGDCQRYRTQFEHFHQDWPQLVREFLAPMHLPRYPLKSLAFALKAFQSATAGAKGFKGKALRALWGGMAAHAMLPLSHPLTSGVAMMLLLSGHTGGWPIPKGGSQSIANALAAHFTALGGEIVTNYYVDSMEKLPKAKTILFDVGPKQLLAIAGHRFSGNYRRKLGKYRYGMGVYKVDWILNESVPFTSLQARMAGTVHIGNTFEEIATAEQLVWEGKHPENPFVLLAQQSLFDVSRTPNHQQVLWGYCHVPNGSTKNMEEAIEQQIERFAPGFRDCIVAKQVTNAQQMEARNPNYIGGDINGGLMDVRQFFARPVLRRSPYGTSAKGIYICSSSTPPGGGVHGMCGYYAAKRALKEIFGIRV